MSPTTGMNTIAAIHETLLVVSRLLPKISMMATMSRIRTIRPQTPANGFDDQLEHVVAADAAGEQEQRAERRA